MERTYVKIKHTNSSYAYDRRYKIGQWAPLEHWVKGSVS